jgi:CRP-like cAMP-binding protein
MAIFSDCNDSAFIAHVLKRMKPAAFAAGQHIISQGFSGRAMYFIIAGVVEKAIAPSTEAAAAETGGGRVGSLRGTTNDGQEDASHVKEILHEGNFFGHEALLNGIEHQYGIRAFSACSMYACCDPLLSPLAPAPMLVFN